MPSIVRYDYVALRFLPQDQFERSAPLDIIPKPDVVTRVFMLFQGVNCSDLGNWEEARQRAQQDAFDWRTVVGVESSSRQIDPSLFRVLEWGGMEIK